MESIVPLILLKSHRCGPEYFRNTIREYFEPEFPIFRRFYYQLLGKVFDFVWEKERERRCFFLFLFFGHYSSKCLRISIKIISLISLKKNLVSQTVNKKSRSGEFFALFALKHPRFVSDLRCDVNETKRASKSIY